MSIYFSVDSELEPRARCCRSAFTGLQTIESLMTTNLRALLMILFLINNIFFSIQNINYLSTFWFNTIVDGTSR
jgi:hypothetical protein